MAVPRLLLNYETKWNSILRIISFFPGSTKANGRFYFFLSSPLKYFLSSLRDYTLGNVNGLVNCVLKRLVYDTYEHTSERNRFRDTSHPYIILVFPDCNESLSKYHIYKSLFPLKKEECKIPADNARLN